jgi:L-alanine-DL-glutamate epimerase-like enolase superfamily enzyme
VSDGTAITRIEIIEDESVVDPAQDRAFVGVSSPQATGWYGPIRAAAATLIWKELRHAVLGRDCRDHQGTHNGLLAIAERSQPSDDTPWAVGSLDCAIWDLHGQIEAKSVAELLGARQVSDIRAYASWLRFDLKSPSMADTVEAIAGQGWSFAKWGVRAAASPGAEARDGSNLASLVSLVRAASKGVPAFDAVRTWSLPTALAFAGAVNQRDIRWLEDPFDIASENYEHLPASFPSIAAGETIAGLEELRSLLTCGRVKHLSLDVVGFGGITPFIHAIGLADAHGVKIYPHGRSLMPAIHVAAANPASIGEVEYQLQWEPIRQSMYARNLEPVSGSISIGGLTGLGAVPRRTT